jgi:hypothetical protein
VSREPGLSSNPWSIKWLPWLSTPVSQPFNHGACSIAAAWTLGLVTGRICLPRAPGRVKLCSAPCVVVWVLFAVDEADHIRVASSLATTFAKASRMRLLELAELAAMSAERCTYMRACLLRQVMCLQQQCAHTRHVHAIAAHLAFACTAPGAALAPSNHWTRLGCVLWLQDGRRGAELCYHPTHPALPRGPGGA